MSLKSPTPFGVDTKKSVQASGKVPLSFGALAKTSSSTPALASVGISQGTAIITNKEVAPQALPYLPASEYEAQMWKVVREFEASLKSLRKKMGEGGDGIASGMSFSEFEAKVEGLVSGCEELWSASVTLGSRVQDQKQRSVFLLSRSDDVDRQLQESQRLIDEQIRPAHSSTGGANILNDQPLDAESEKLRLGIATKALVTQKAVGNIQDQIRLMENIFDLNRKKGESSENLIERMSRPGYSPRQAFRSDENVIKAANMALFDALKRGYDRTGQVEACLDKLQRQIHGLSESLLPLESANKEKMPISEKYVRKKSIKRGVRIAPLSVMFASPLASKKLSSKRPSSDSIKISKRQSSIEAAVRKLGSNTSNLRVKEIIQRQNVISNSKRTEPHREISHWRSSRRSQLVSFEDTPQTLSRGLTFQSPAPATSVVRPLFSSPTSTTKRLDWEITSTVDQASLNAITLDIPTSVKKIDSLSLSREALGT